ncbi:MAG: hypothetical protein ABIA75_13785 [Candidatus Neomarinimicrobiota bacterium]
MPLFAVAVRLPGLEQDGGNARQLKSIVSGSPVIDGYGGRIYYVYSTNYRGVIMNVKDSLLVLALALPLLADPAENSRLADLNADSLNHVTIQVRNGGGLPETKTVNDCQAIARIVEFLQGMELTTPAGGDTTYTLDHDDWRFHIVLNGYYDQVFLFDRRAFIGKSVYGIKPATLAEFHRLYSELE